MRGRARNRRLRDTLEVPPSLPLSLSLMGPPARIPIPGYEHRILPILSHTLPTTCWVSHWALVVNSVAIALPSSTPTTTLPSPPGPSVLHTPQSHPQVSYVRFGCLVQWGFTVRLGINHRYIVVGIKVLILLPSKWHQVSSPLVSMAPGRTSRPINSIV